MEEPFDDVYDDKFDLDDAVEVHGVDTADSRVIDELIEGVEPEDVDVDGLIEAGVGYVSINRFEQAVEAFDRAIRFDEENQEAWVNKGFAHAEMEEYDRAIGAYEEALRVSEDDEFAAEALVNKAYAEYESRRGDPLETVERALEIDDRMPEGWYNRAVFLNERGQHEEALRCIDNALSLGLRGPRALDEKARALEELGRYEEAEELREEAVEKSETQGEEGMRL
ncbi:MAG: tetratricopeptide repeat protein [Halobacteriales archaeon]|nr:tetratricopeptide repeat protein [Halobacteriales archaeon]